MVAIPILFELPALLTVERANALLAIALLVTVLGADLREVSADYVTWVVIILVVIFALLLLVNRLVGPRWALSVLLAQLVISTLFSLFSFGRLSYALLSDLVGVLSSKSLYES